MRVRFILLGSLGLTAILAVTLAVTGRRPMKGAAVPARVSTAIPAAAPALQRPSEHGPVRMVRFILFETGIYPSELRVQQGLVNLALEDKTNSMSGLVVERVTGSDRSRAGEVRRSPNHWRGRSILRLTPGRYNVYDASRPANKAVLLVEP